MGWVVAGAWLGAGVIALVILGFCAYELTWKSRRLTSDLERLGDLSARLAELQAEVDVVLHRAATAKD